jgi:hypothetical protein
MVVQTDLPHADVRSNSLDVVGDIMAVVDENRIVYTVDRFTGGLYTLETTF